MSFLSGSTKKVSVYGRKAEVRVVNRHTDFTLLGKDENDPFGFFTSQPKPKSTYGRSRTSVLPTQLCSKSFDSDNEAPDDSMTAADDSAQYATADSSASSHSASSSAPPSKAAHTTLSKPSSTASQRQALSDRTLNDTSKKQPARRRSPVKRAKPAAKLLPPDEAVMATPKAQRASSKRTAVDSPQTLRKPPQSKPAISKSAPDLPNESTPPPAKPAGRAPRRAAQAARVAIEDYDFTDRDMTPRRPVPTKSYFVEKARQLAEIAQEEEAERRKAQAAVREPKVSTVGARQTSRKSMAPRLRHTSALGNSMRSAIAISDSSMSSAADATDSSFDTGGTSQSSFSLAGPSSDESFGNHTKRSSASKARAKQNKRITRRIVATSDDEDEDVKSDEGSDDEVEQDPTVKLASQIADLDVEEESGDSHLSDLLDTVAQTKLDGFADVLQQLRTAQRGGRSRLRLEKIGEASYSEVFKIFAPATSRAEGHEPLVLKIIPIASAASLSNEEGGDLPYTSPAADVEREIRLMQLIGGESSVAHSFVTLRSAHVVKGTYPVPLLQAWDRWDAKRRAKTGEGAENIRPDVLGGRQAYALIVMTDGGMDLESLKIKSWLQAASIFWQVVAGLGEMESKYEFEHRDLHWGNILVQTVAMEGNTSRSVKAQGATGWLLDASISGVKATIIDFTLSRAAVVTGKGRSKNSETLQYPFDDESIFEGTGDSQFDVYREMRIATKGAWHTYCPATNMLWLRYLARKLIDDKCAACKTPKTANGGEMEAKRERDAYMSLLTAAERLDAAAEAVLDARKKKPALVGRKSLHPRARKSVLPPASGSVRRGRATTAVTPLIHEGVDSKQYVQSAGDLLSLL